MTIRQKSSTCATLDTGACAVPVENERACDCMTDPAGYRAPAWVVLTALLLAMVDCTSGCDRPESSVTASDETIGSIRVAALDFGDVWTSPDFRWSLPLTNESDDELSVEVVGTTCSCTSYTPKFLRIPPRKTAAVELVLNLAGGSDQASAAPLREFLVELRAVVSSGRGRTISYRWPVHGRVKTHPVPVLPQSIDLSSATPSTFERSLSREVAVTSKVPLRDIDIDCRSDRISATVAPAGKADGYQWRLFVSPRAAGPIDEAFSEQVTIAPISRTGERLPGLSLRVTARESKRVVTCPSSIQFGPSTVGSVTSEIVTICPAGSASVSLISAESDSPSLATEMLPSAEPGTCQLRLMQSIVEAGHHEHRIQLKVDVHGDTTTDEIVTLELRVRYHGVAHPAS